MLNSEADVETHVLIPLLKGELYLNVPAENVRSKSYMALSDLDKGAKGQKGYYPDFSVWIHIFPIMIVEAKPPGIPVERAYQEACLYAQKCNQPYSSGVNPTRFVVGCNGKTALFGYWDSEPEVTLHLDEIRVGNAKLDEVIAKFGFDQLAAHAQDCLNKVKSKAAVTPASLAGGSAILTGKKALNSFAAELSPVLTRFFASTTNDTKEIAEKAYVSSAEVTEYDKIFESLLKDRVNIHKDTIVKVINPERHSEENVEKALKEFADKRPKDGRLQIIQGAVGSGKSLFIRRYQQVLQPKELQDKSRWAWIDFNAWVEFNTSSDISQRWLCESFIKSFREENPSIDLDSMDVLKGIFSRNIQKRNAIYSEVAKGGATDSAARMRGEDLAKWQDDPIEFMRGLGNYVMGGRNEILIVVLDNVDRMDLDGQLKAFSLGLWLMNETKAFVVLQMRDETYERFKNQKPLDTYRTGIAFHITPPRFIDVVKKRLDLSIQYLAEQSKDTHTYMLPSGIRIAIPRSDLGTFLHELYVELFERRRNVSRILESLAGLDVRRALDMFSGIITSGHLREDQITSQVAGNAEVRITEHNILKILMRGEYRFFSDNSGLITNIFHFENNWQNPHNFIIPEILFYLANNRKKTGQIGTEGYFSVPHLAGVMQARGIDPEDTLAATNYLLNRYLVNADHMNHVKVGLGDSVKIAASGYIHLRILAERLEYLYGIIPVVKVTNAGVVKALAETVERESRIGSVSEHGKRLAVSTLCDYLWDEAESIAERTGRPFDKSDKTSGSIYVLRQLWKVRDALPGQRQNTPNQLDA